MQEIKIDIGKNITETAKNSGASRFGQENHWGLAIFELVDLKPDVVVRYTRPGFEITAHPLFSLTMYADSENKNNMAVERVELLYRYDAKSHDDAKHFIEDLAQQFRQGSWKRHIHETSPAVSGRSAYLDTSGNINGRDSLDPDYRIPMEDWLQLMSLGDYFEWIGDGVLARLQVKYDNDARGLTYSIDLVFQDYPIEVRRSAQSEAKRLADGDKKGWHSTEKHKTEMEKNKQEIKILEQNAVRRGDHLVARD